MNKWNAINNIFPTDEMRHSTEEENKLYSDMLERKSKTMEEYNKDNRIMNRIQEHLNDALNSKPTDWFVICGQGSINYPGLSDNQSDVDSKMLTVPSFKDLIFNKKPMNTVHEMDNGEHVDMKSTIHYFQILKKQNINFVEILFTDYWVSNEIYDRYWLEIRRYAEEIAHMNPARTLKCIYGMSLEKQHALEKPYPSKIHLIEKYGYDGKQLSHVLRINEFAKKFIEGYSYKECLSVDDPEYLIAIKRNQANLSLEQARQLMDETVSETKSICDLFLVNHKDKNNSSIENILDEILYSLLKESVKKEFL